MSCGIVVEYEYRRVGDALEHLRMLVGECRALRRDRDRKARRVKPYRVDLTLAHDRLAMRRLCDMGRRPVEGEQHLRLLEDRRLGRIHVLAGILLLHELAPRERHHPALTILDRKHQPAAEPVVAEVARTRRTLDDARRLKFLRRIAILLGPLEDRRHPVRRVAYQEIVLNLRAKVALYEVVARNLRLAHLAEAPVVELRQLRHEREKPLSEPRLGVLTLLELDAALLGELAHGGHEVQPLVLHHKLYRVARLSAAEAVVEPLRDVYVEAWSLFVVERTARLEARTRMLYGYAVGGDQVRKVYAGLDVLQHAIGDSRHPFPKLNPSPSGRRP